MMKKIGKILLLVMIFVGGFAVGLGTKFYIDEWRAARNVVAWMDSLDPFKNDNYGGATPEETFDMYLAALKKGDLELASKYFVNERFSAQLKELRQENDLDNYIKELSSITKDSWIKSANNDELAIKYSATRYKERVVQTISNDGKFVDEKLLIGPYFSTMVFRQVNNIWKIYLL